MDVYYAMHSCPDLSDEIMGKSAKELYEEDMNKEKEDLDCNTEEGNANFCLLYYKLQNI